MMKQLTGKRLSTSLYDVEDRKALIRVTVWIDPETLEVHPDDNGETPTVQVKGFKGRTLIYGSVDREALDESLGRVRKDRGAVAAPPLLSRPPVAPSAEPQSRVLAQFPPR